MKLTNSEKLAYSTVRIECVYNNGSRGSGTGFFYNFDADGDSGGHYPSIITNKHVVRDANEVNLVFVKSDENNNPLDREHFTVKFNLDNCIFYKEENIDLCTFLIGHMLNEIKEANINLFYIPLDKTILPTQKQLTDLSTLEDIIMIGYPNGLWDSVNNKPIFRKGVTATHPNLDYNSKKEFVIDIACFPGSSGSPIFIYNESGYTDRSGNIQMGMARIILIGILYAGPVMKSEGEVKIVEIPTAQKAISESSNMINLGYAIKTEYLIALEKQVNTFIGGLKNQNTN